MSLYRHLTSDLLKEPNFASKKNKIDIRVRSVLRETRQNVINPPDPKLSLRSSFIRVYTSAKGILTPVLEDNTQQINLILVTNDQCYTTQSAKNK